MYPMLHGRVKGKRHGTCLSMQLDNSYDFSMHAQLMIIGITHNYIFLLQRTSCQAMFIEWVHCVIHDTTTTLNDRQA